MLRVASIAIVLMAACSAPPRRPPPPPEVDREPSYGLDEPSPDEPSPDEPSDPPPPASTDGLAAEDAQLLAAHNAVRARYCAAPLAWSKPLADEATAWARTLAGRGCAFEHSNTDHGENLAAGTEGALGPEEAVAMWADEASAYDYRRPRFGMKTGHFTQVVWRDTRSVGCGSARCNGLTLWVCNYDPPGNVEGEFPANVARPPCR